MADAERGLVGAKAAEVYEDFFVPALFGQWPDRVLAAAGATAGDRILDVGCGTGVLARVAASRAGRAGKVVGLDPNPGMLSVARRAPQPIDWVEGRAEQLPFADASFDRVVSQFALMFFVDRRGAVVEMGRVLRPGGRIAIATWASLDETPGYAAVVHLLRRLFGDAAASAMRAPFALSDHDELRQLLEVAFEDVKVETCPGVARFRSVDSWVHTDIRGWTLADMIDDEQYQTLLAAAHGELRAFTKADGSVEFVAPAVISSGTAPGAR